MKRFILYLFALLSFSSCTIRFDRYPGNTLNEFPEEMKGRYLFASRKEKDSTYVTITSHTISFSDNNILKSGGLSDSIKLAKGSKYYYLCWGDSLKGRFVWDVYPVKVSGKKLQFYALDAELYKKPIKKHFKPIAGFEDLYEMNEARLDHFCKTKLRNRNALKLTRVN